MAPDSSAVGASATAATDRLREWSVVTVGLALGALPVLAVVLQPATDGSTMAPPVLAAAAIVAAGALLRRLPYTSRDVAVVAAWVAASAVGFAVVIAITVLSLVADPVSVGAFVTAFMAPIGAVSGLVAGYTDARRRRQYRRTRRSRHAIEAATDGVAIIDADGGFATVNPAHAEIFGYDGPDALLGRNWLSCYPDEERRRIEAEALPNLEAGEAWRGEATGERSDGTTFPLELTLTPIEDDGYVAVTRDIGERRERERRLRRQTRRLRTVVENAPIVLFAVDDDGEFLFVEGQGLERYPLDPADLEGVAVFELGRESAGIETAARRAFGGSSGHATVRIGDRVLKTWFRPVLDDGDVDRVVGAAMDITDRHERERRLTELHDASRQLTYAETRTEVAETAVELAADALEQPVAALWRYDEAADCHRPVAMTDGAADRVDVDDVESLPEITPGDDAHAAFRDH